MCLPPHGYDHLADTRTNLMGLAGHVAAYLVVNAGLLALNLLTSPEHLWFCWPLLGWSFGVTMHTVRVLRFETLPEAERERLLTAAPRPAR